MMTADLTSRARPATNAAMKETHDVQQHCQSRHSQRWPVRAVLLAVAGAIAVSGCVSVNAPDKPIVIELNMNIKMDVVYKLSGDASKTVDTNKEIF
jgi:hypothetical protein